MDQGQGSQARGIPRLSRLPMPRTGTGGNNAQQDDPVKSQLPRSNISIARSGIRPLGESFNAATQRHTSQIWRNSAISPVQNSTFASQIASLDTTPPSLKQTTISPIDGDENHVIDDSTDTTLTNATKKAKRLPRPSLSERTIETLAQVSPTSSPNRTRSSTNSSRASTLPSVRPPSVSKLSRPTTPSKSSFGRPVSPSRKPFRPPGRNESPIKDAPPVPSVPSMDNIYTPPRAFLRDRTGRTTKPSHEPKRSISTAVSAPSDAPQIRKLNPQSSKTKSMYDLRATASRFSAQPSMPTTADAAKPSTPASKPRPAHRDTSPHASLLKARRPGENVLAPTTKAATTPSKQPTITKRAVVRNSPSPAASSESTRIPSKGSAALRDTIAKARAAKRAASRETPDSPAHGDMQWSEDSVPFFDAGPELGTGSLKRKLTTAVTTGVLNLSGLSLKELPAEVMTMYNYNADSKIDWSEAVDLTKLLLADNEISELSESQFPDWTQEEMLDDPDKSNQFGGVEVLDLHNNHLKTIPMGFRRLGRLATLNLNGNGFSSDPFPILTQITALRELRLSACSLGHALPSTIDQLVNLQTLDLSSNGLSDLPRSIASLTSLQKLFLGDNKLREIDMTALQNLPLIELDISKNSLRGTLFDCPCPSKLRSLDASFNELTRVAHGCLELPELLSLAIHNNKLAELPDLSRCLALTTLTAGENSLSEIQDSFYDLKELRNADLSGNSIKIIDSKLIGLENLVTLSLGGNPLREKKFLSMTVQDIRADLAKKISVPSFDGNSNTARAAEHDTVPGVKEPKADTRPAPKQGVLDLSSRELTSVSSSVVDLSSKVHTIRLSNNLLREFPVELLSHENVKHSLKSLDLSHNPSLHPTDYLSTQLELPALESLYIVSTGLTTLDTLTAFLTAPRLRELNISCHRLAGPVPSLRSFFPSITTLLASDNWFESIDVDDIRGLEVIDIRNNEIEHLPPKIGLLGKRGNSTNADGCLRSFEVSGNRFRVPRLLVVERGTDAILKDLRRMVPADQVPEEWMNEA